MSLMSKVFNLSIGKEKIIQLQTRKNAVISHRKTARWISISKKFPKVKNIRLFNPIYDYDIMATIIAIEYSKSLGEDIVKITVQL